METVDILKSISNIPSVNNLSLSNVLIYRNRALTNADEKFFDIIKSAILLKMHPEYSEEILVVDKDSIANYNTMVSNPINLKKVMDTITKKSYKIMRAVAEKSPQYVQVVSQFIIKCNDMYYLATKHSKSNETSLIGSVGFIGGHINDISNLNNELYEEVIIDKNDIENISGVSAFIWNRSERISFNNHLKKNTNYLVDIEHCGLVFIVDMKNMNVNINPDEQDKLSGGWYSLDELRQIENLPLDSWSRIILNQVI